mmetsp:Transcript_2857/g.10911  ORF Transcript_2857/g.10911 Transcript_2857/m.10911 type:complete len:128 (+) Transcript_2857:608-991(+)
MQSNLLSLTRQLAPVFTNFIGWSLFLRPSHNLTCQRAPDGAFLDYFSLAVGYCKNNFKLAWIVLNGCCRIVHSRFHVSIIHSPCTYPPHTTCKKFHCLPSHGSCSSPLVNGNSAMARPIVRSHRLSQ